MLRKNNLYIGSIKDSSNVWHAVISSPDEDFCHRYCQQVSGDELDPELAGDSFFTNTYTVELLPIVITEEIFDDEDWTNFDTWVEADEGDLYQEELED